MRIVDVRITDLPGIWQHFSVPARAVDADTFSDGIGFDGSSIRGFQEIHESDMLVIPDPTTAFLDPFTEVPTLILICNVRDPVTGQAYSRDARYIAQKAEAYLKSSGIGETAYFGPEAEFFVFDDVRYGQGTNFGFYEVDSAEGNGNSGAEQNPNLGHKPRPKEGYFPVPPSDSQQDLRTEMVLTLEDIGIAVEAHHHEVATGGQAEIDMRFDALTRMADNLMIYKYVVKNVARARGMTATFMPKPLFDDNGSGMRRPPEHLERRYAAVLRRGRLRRAEPDGPLLHRRPVEAHRGAVRHRRPDHQLVPPPGAGIEAPINLVYSQRNRSACCRIPMYSPDPKAKRVEFRTPDPSTNGYLGFAALLMAGLDGIENRIDPGEPIDKNLYDLPPEEAAQVTSTPGSLDEALDALQADHDFLLKGDVFTPDVIETYLDYKRSNEVDQIRLRPHPHEFFLYYDV